MRIEEYIVSAWTKRLSEKTIKDAIEALEQMTSSEMLSGDDSGLKNVWEEICVQVQYQESAFWDAYVDTIDMVLARLIELLDFDTRLALWAVTDEGWNYIYEHHADDDGVGDVPVSENEIASKLRDDLLLDAANYSNLRISRYLMRHEDGYDELEEEDDGDLEEEEDEASN